jgi:signal peptidase I
MVWELVGWLVLGAALVVIVANFFVGRSTAMAGGAGVASTQSPMHGILELAWPVFFVGSMGMLTWKEIMTFPAVLLSATVITAAIWSIDQLLFSKRRGGGGQPVVVEMARGFFPVILIVFFLRSFLYEPFKIPSESMLPTLHVGDFILVNKFTYGLRLPVVNSKLTDGTGPQRGDIMVFRLPENPAKDLIKRVIGVPGDRVAYINKRLTINDQTVAVQAGGSFTQVDEQLALHRYDALQETFAGQTHTILQNPRLPAYSPAGVRYFPQREQCQYRTDGFICTVPPGHYFMMGDNRDNSDDSRYWGFVPDENIVGKAVRIWMNFGELKRIGNAIE